MTISDYASLLVDAGAYSGRDDIAHLFPRFVALAEQKFNRVLRLADMEKTATLALTKARAPCPPTSSKRGRCLRRASSCCGRGRWLN